MNGSPCEYIVCVIDDDDGVRGSLDSLLRSEGFEVRLYDTTEAFIADGRPKCAACLLLDVKIREENGLDFQDRLKELGISIPVIIMTGHGDIPMTVRGMRAGAMDFLPKPFADDQMISAVSSAIEKDRVMRAASESAERLAELYQELTGREKEVMSLVVTGLMNKQVAARLSLSEITVKIHRGNLMRKMRAQSLADLVRMAEQLGIRDETIRRFDAPA